MHAYVIVLGQIQDITKNDQVFRSTYLGCIQVAHTWNDATKMKRVARSVGQIANISLHKGKNQTIEKAAAMKDVCAPAYSRKVRQRKR
jgi:hypothetical protein